ncbi:MAG: C-terminal binding protein [Planctomycetaceae bacterium]|nr:C-terminal binding protein [Planctomycetaceae bacterium]
MPQRVLLTDHPWSATDIEREILDAAGVELIEAPAGDAATLSQLAGDVSAIATCWAQVTRGVIESATQCRLIARLGIGLDNIDRAAAAERGMLVTNVPDYCVEEVADHAWGLLLALARNIAFFHRRTKQGEYDLKAGPPMHRLPGRTLGLIGIGRIARAMVPRARGSGVHVVAHSRSGNDYGTGVEMLDLDDLLQRSDFVSIHAPLTPQTRHLLNAERLRHCRPGQFLVNTARGPLIDPDALWEALQANRIAGAALDVFEPEPPDLSHPLYGDERVIVTPHAAFVSEESVTELRRRTMEQIVTCLQGGVPENVVPNDPT